MPGKGDFFRSIEVAAASAAVAPIKINAAGTTVPRASRRIAPDVPSAQANFIATQDHNINPDFERKMAAHAGSDTIELSGNHALYVSRPNEVAALIERAAKAAGN